MDEWKRRIENKDIVVGILGLGYVGLPLARGFASAERKVIGFDVDEILENMYRSVNTKKRGVHASPTFRFESTV